MTDGKAFFILGVLCATVIFWRKPEFLTRLARLGDNNKDEYDLVIGILSARDHFRERRAIRDTWLQATHKAKDMRVKTWFVVGREACPHHPADRLDAYSCERWTPKLYPEADDLCHVGFSVKHHCRFSSRNANTFVSKFEEPLLQFQVRHPVELKGVGGLDHRFDKIQWTLEDLSSQEEVSNGTCFQDQPVTHGNTEYSTSDQENPLPFHTTSHFLPKGFEGQIHLACDTCPEDFLKTGGLVVKINAVGAVIDISQPQMHKGSPVSISFLLHERDRLAAHISGASKRASDWADTVAEETRRLEEEIAAHGDILLVDVMDTYRNLPGKLLKFHQKLQEVSTQQYVMKTDDDCFVNVEKLIAGLKELNWTRPEKVWWSRFRDQWLVERHGKWREMTYTPDVYPRFACGTGNVVSDDISKWLADNAGRLHAFQGEDVSMGIWLAALGVNYAQDNDWQCDSTWEDSSYASSQLSPDEIKDLWTNQNLT